MYEVFDLVAKLRSFTFFQSVELCLGVATVGGVTIPCVTGNSPNIHSAAAAFLVVAAAAARVHIAVGDAGRVPRQRVRGGMYLLLTPVPLFIYLALRPAPPSHRLSLAALSSLSLLGYHCALTSQIHSSDGEVCVASLPLSALFVLLRFQNRMTPQKHRK